MTGKVMAVLLLLVPLAATAQNDVDFAPDVTAPLGTGPSLVVNDHDLAHDNATGGVIGFLIPPGVLPANVQIEGYHALATGNTLLVVDTTTALPGLPPGSPAEGRDVVEYSPGAGTFSVFFDGAAAGVPANAQIDALSVNAALEPQLSFETSVLLPGVGPVDDEDVVVYAGGAFAMVYDGSAAGIATALDLDAVQPVPAGLLVSFDTTGSIGALTFDDEDVLQYDIGLGTHAMYFDASVSDPVDWPRADLSALPEPDLALAIAAGAALLAGFVWIRRAPG